MTETHYAVHHGPSNYASIHTVQIFAYQGSGYGLDITGVEPGDRYSWEDTSIDTMLGKQKTHAVTLAIIEAMRRLKLDNMVMGQQRMIWDDKGMLFWVQFDHNGNLLHAAPLDLHIHFVNPPDTEAVGIAVALALAVLILGRALTYRVVSCGQLTPDGSLLPVDGGGVIAENSGFELYVATDVNGDGGKTQPSHVPNGMEVKLFTTILDVINHVFRPRS